MILPEGERLPKLRDESGSSFHNDDGNGSYDNALEDESLCEFDNNSCGISGNGWLQEGGGRG